MAVTYRSANKTLGYDDDILIVDSANSNVQKKAFLKDYLNKIVVGNCDHCGSGFYEEDKNCTSCGAPVKRNKKEEKSEPRDLFNVQNEELSKISWNELVRKFGTITNALTKNE